MDTAYTAGTGDYDFRRHDQLWQRIAPGLEAYPPQEEGDAPAAGPGTAQAAGDGLTAQEAAALPGAEQDPCCMGSEAAELLAVIEGYIQEELEDRRRYLALARRAPAWARQTLRQMAQEDEGHARRLMAAHYLITGRQFFPALRCAPIAFDTWRKELRRSYHQAACGGLNYARSADSTGDLCLRELFSDLSADEYRRARILMEMTERGVSRPGASC